MDVSNPPEYANTTFSFPFSAPPIFDNCQLNDYDLYLSIIFQGHTILLKA